jgi:regulator of replication initiation timing
VTDVSQAVNEHLVKENERLVLENSELRASLAHARDQWKLMSSVVSQLERMDGRLEQALSRHDESATARDMDRLRRMKADRVSYSTNTTPFS